MKYSISSSRLASWLASWLAVDWHDIPLKWNGFLKDFRHFLGKFQDFERIFELKIDFWRILKWFLRFINGFLKDFWLFMGKFQDLERIFGFLRANFRIFEICNWIFEGFSAFFGEISIYLDFAIRFLKNFRQFLGKFIT